MSDPAPSAPRRNVRWMSLGPASRLLGVDPDTLRRWADEGRVATWTTPGGHRRFERQALERMATGRRTGSVVRPLATLGASPERLRRAYRRHYAVVASPASPAGPRDDGERETFRRDGRRLVDALVAYLDARDDEVERDRTEALSVAIVVDHATRLATGGSSLTESVALFVAARRPFLAEIASLGRRRAFDPAHLAGLYEDASALLDRLLLRFIDAYQRAGREA